MGVANPPVDMYFDDGTNPTDEIVRQFIYLVEEWVSRGKKIAVHCKAGLGRTGVLIGAYLIYKYNFTASEVIGYMRVVRPGMVVGPQQRYMQLNQLKWAGWVSSTTSARTNVRLLLTRCAAPPSLCLRRLRSMRTFRCRRNRPRSLGLAVRSLLPALFNRVSQLSRATPSDSRARALKARTRRSRSPWWPTNPHPAPPEHSKTEPMLQLGE